MSFLNLPYMLANTSRCFRYRCVKGVGKVLYSSSASRESFDVIYKEHGDPAKVLGDTAVSVSLATGTGTATGRQGNRILIKMLAAPINPSDINMIQGVYPVKPAPPAVGGNEGVGEVIEVEEAVTSLQPGDWVVPGHSGWGTWRTLVSCRDEDVIKIPNNIPTICAATLAVNPCTAYRMLKDFADLEPGGVVIQNAANSGVGQAVIQIAKELGIETINIIRNRPNVDDLECVLKDLGATHVITDEFVRSAEMKTFMKSLPKPKLALNGVSGKSVADVMKYLDQKAAVVTYGGMAKLPMMIPAGPLIFNDVRLFGYWNTRWSAEHKGSPEREYMWEFLCDMIHKGTLKVPVCRLVPIADYQEAVDKSMQPFITEKQVLVMENDLI